jgi:hypothetical protein
MRKRDGHFVNFCTLTPFSDHFPPFSRGLRWLSNRINVCASVT